LRQQAIIHSRVRDDNLLELVALTMNREMSRVVSSSVRRIQSKVDDIWRDIRRDIAPQTSKMQKSDDFECQYLNWQRKYELKGRHKSVVDAAQNVETELWLEEFMKGADVK
jgi:hypothetical protein